MSSTQVVILGALAGLTIFLGLPFGRMTGLRPGTRAVLNAVAIGILLFLLWDVLTHATEPVEAALVEASTTGTDTWARFVLLAGAFAGSLTVGLMGLVYYDRHLRRHSARSVGAAVRTNLPPASATSPASPASPATPTSPTSSSLAGVIGRLSEPKRLALFIAMGIGVHNLAEGLAIGQSAANGEISLALALIIGFGLHNGTEGFGIIAPLTDERPSWAFLILLGLIGGGPTFLGTVAGQQFTNDTFFVATLALAAGSLIYVILQLVALTVRHPNKVPLMWGLLAGLMAGFATDFVLVAVGA